MFTAAPLAGLFYEQGESFMRTLFRPRFIFTAALLICATLSAHEVRAQTVGPGDVLISEFRFSGPGGDSDEYVELYCNRDTDCDISNYLLQGYDPSIPGDYQISLGAGVVIPARGNLLIGDSSQYSLPDYAILDLDVSAGFDVFIDNEGLQLRDDTGEFIIDSVGFTGGGNDVAYIEGTGLQRATAARPADQYAYVRKMGTATGGRPQDTNDNANDFVLVSVTGAAHPGITAPPILGAPGPQSKTSPPTYDSASQLTGALVEPGVSQASAPNRVRTGSGDSGTLSIRRSITNNTNQSFDYLSFRAIDITTLNSPVTLGGQAQLRLVTSGDAETFMNSQGRTVVIRGTVLEFDDGTEPNQPNGGGLNSTVHVALAEGEQIKPGQTVDVQFLLNVVQAGAFRFYVNIEAFPSSLAAAASVAGSPVAASRTRNAASSARVTRRLVVMKRAATLWKSVLKKGAPIKAKSVVFKQTDVIKKTSVVAPKAVPVTTKVGAPVTRLNPETAPARTSPGAARKP
jgi:hypothetical protein